MYLNMFKGKGIVKQIKLRLHVYLWLTWVKFGMWRKMVKKWTADKIIGKMCKTIE